MTNICTDQLRHITRIADDLVAEHRARWEQLTDAEDRLARARRNLARIEDDIRRAPIPARHDYSNLGTSGNLVTSTARHDSISAGR